jgi:cellulose synthase/poly-beta-1,6-N-acetylglucosamine synthase-like glycosyltransferase
MRSYPKISIVTASYNQGAFLERTILSVLSQNYENLEYIIIDGGSTDNSLEIIKKYETKLTYWCSEPDAGQYNAINKGFKKSTGDIMAFLNADDVYLPWTLHTVSSIFTALPQVQWLTSLRPNMLNEKGSIIASGEITPISKKAFIHGLYVPGSARSLGVVVQEGTFWSASLWKKSGACLNESFKLAADFDLWTKFFRHTELYGLGFPLAAMTRHKNQRSNALEKYTAECFESLAILQQHEKITSASAARFRKIVLRLKRNPFVWRMAKRILNYTVSVVDTQYDEKAIVFNWGVKSFTIY